MAAYNKFNQFTEDVCRGVYNFSSTTPAAARGAHTFAVILTNTAPVATNAVYADVSGTEIATGGGYTAGGITNAGMTDSTSSGTEKAVYGTNPVWTGSGGGFGPFRYVIVMDTTPTTPLKPLIAWFDYGSSISLNAGDTFTVSFDGTNGLFQMT
jgi:hypothetical protein